MPSSRHRCKPASQKAHYLAVARVFLFIGSGGFAGWSIAGCGARARPLATAETSEIAPKDATKSTEAKPSSATPDAEISTQGHMVGPSSEKVWEGAPLTHFFEALADLEQHRQRVIHILHYGDSHTAAGVLTAAIRRALQERFGDAGPGFVLLGRPWPTYKPPDLKAEANGHWKTKRFVAKADVGDLDHCCGLAGVAIDSAKRGAKVALTLTPNEPDKKFPTNLALFYLNQPLGGAFSIFVDGVQQRQVYTNAERISPGFIKATLDQATRKLEVRVTANRPVRLFGAALENGSPGIVYDGLGINGAFFYTPLRWDADLLAAHVAQRNPELVITMYGANEAELKSLTPQAYARDIRATLARLLAGSPDADCLVIGPADRVLGDGQTDNSSPLDWIVEVQKEVALEKGCGFLDARALMGGPGSFRRWERAGLAQSDGVHFSGSGYVELGARLARQILDAYDRFVAELALEKNSLKNDPPAASLNIVRNNKMRRSHK